MTGRGRIRIGSPARGASTRARVEEITALLQSSGLEAEAVEEIEPVIWEKAAINCAINPLAAILGVTNGALLESPAFEIGVEAARETAAVARAHGIALPEHGWSKRVEQICRATARNRCSMLGDVEAGRRTEIDALNGRVATRAIEKGLTAPVNQTLSSIVRAMELTRLPGKESSPEMSSEHQERKRDRNMNRLEQG